MGFGFLNVHNDVAGWDAPWQAEPQALLSVHLLWRKRDPLQRI